MPAERSRRGLDRRFSSRARHDLAGARRQQWEAPWLARTARHLRSPRVLRSQRLEPRSARRCCRVRQPTLNRTTNGGKCRGQPETSKGAGKKRVRATSHPPRAKPSLRPLAPSATPRASCTRTRSPPRALASAHDTPVIPAPMIATSTVRSRPESTGFVGSSSQNGVRCYASRR